jgi:hypothetical protein
MIHELTKNNLNILMFLTQLCSVAYSEGKKLKVVSIHAMTAYRGSRGIAPLILHLGFRWR